ncbi:MAG: hypothetical protein ACM3XM_01730 [Mycobacterium leprae]
MTSTAVYLVLILAAVGALLYLLTQVAGRQRRLNAELARLEHLTAEVAMTAEAMLDRVDERIERLSRIADRVEAKVAARAAALEQEESLAAAAQATATAQPVAAAQPSVAAPPSVAEAAAPASTTTPAPRKRGRPRKNPLPEQAPAAPVQQAAAPAPASTPAAPAASQPAVQPGTSFAHRNDKVQAVTALAREGKSVAEIATALAIPRGEVQLILNLRKVTA